MIASGAFHVKNGVITLSGSGDVINIALTIAFSAFLVKWLTPKLGSYAVLLLPLAVAVVAGGLGQVALPYTKMITGAIGGMVNLLTNLQPLVMGMLMGVAFVALIVSPISSVGIAMAIGIEGIASGSANLGITVGAFTLAIMSSKVNGLGTTIAHFVGTPNSAGFGAAGLIGPLAAYKEMTGGPIAILFLIILFVGIPTLLGLMMRYIFIQKLQFVRAEDLKVENK